MATSAHLTLRLTPGLIEELDKLARSKRRSPSNLAAEVIREYVDVNRWQVEHIKKAIEKADRNEFAGDKEVGALFRKLTRRRAR
ncbi:MAG: CopG family transcriptional regulator [Acidobacteria bacterium]|nr:MAG: CopG family transcriptional regulator [Acidobacteriota bacterium]PYY13457.1 MAG: CopG family transcriptional regulator [Acidobacteriota bacterium]